MKRLIPILFTLLLAQPALARDLPATETPIGRLALPVVPDSLVISPDSSRLAFATKAGNTTPEDKGIFFHPPTGEAEDPNLPSNLRALMRLSIDDKSSATYEVLTPVIFSPDGKHLGFAGQKEKKWHLLIDNRTLTIDADNVPANPIAFSADSTHQAWVVEKADHYLVAVDDKPWPSIEANAFGLMTFSPDARHVSAVARVKNAWVLYVDGHALPTPTPPQANPPSAPARPAPTGLDRLDRLDRFSQFFWRPDSGEIGFTAAFPNAKWQVFSQSVDGTILFASKPYEALLKDTPVFPPATSPASPHLAFASDIRKKWTVITDTEEFPAAPAPPFENLLTDSLRYILPQSSAPAQLFYLAEQNKQWHLFINHHPDPNLTFDALITSSFIVSPDEHHYAFAGTRNGKAFIVKDGAILSSHDETSALTFAFSPDSQHFAYAARNGTQWIACLDSAPGSVAFAGFAPSPFAFSPDSAQFAYQALATNKTWHLFLNKDATDQTKAYDSFLKNSHVTWRQDNTIVTIAILKKVATRIEIKNASSEIAPGSPGPPGSGGFKQNH